MPVISIGADAGNESLPVKPAGDVVDSSIVRGVVRTCGRAAVRRLCILMILGIAVGLLAAPEAFARPGGKLVPKRGVYLGATLSGGTDGVRAFESMIGRKLAIDHRYWGWQSEWPSDHERWDVRNGRIPMVSWNFVNAGKLDSITSGKWDSVIRDHARRVRRFGNKMFVRWGYEMNGDWFPWSGFQNGQNPDMFVRSWRRIVRIFRQVGARNAVWVWCPARQSHPNESWNAVWKYYPGDRYVNWVCTEAYNWGTTKSYESWHSFGWLVRNVYRLYARRKPIMIGESASAEQGGSKSVWIDQAGDKMRNDFRSIAAYVWFNHTDQNVDWRVNSSTSALKAFRALGARRYFRAHR
jgi:beta-mannanase